MSLVPYLKYLMVETGFGGGQPKPLVNVLDDSKKIVGTTCGGIDMDSNVHKFLGTLMKDFIAHREQIFKEYTNEWVIAEAELIDEISSTGKVPTVEIRNLTKRGRLPFEILDLDEDDFDDEDDEDEYVDESSEEEKEEKKKAVSKPIPKKEPKVQKKTQTKKEEVVKPTDTEDPVVEKPAVKRRGGGRKKKEAVTAEVDVTVPVDIAAE